MTEEQKNIEIALMLGWKYYPKVKIPTNYYDVEEHKLENLDEDDVWVIEPTEEFEKYLCVSTSFYDVTLNIENPFKEFHYLLKFDTDANWMFEAIDFIEGKGYPVEICQENCTILTNEQPLNDLISCSKETKKEAIFEALYEFSQYLKQAK